MLNGYTFSSSVESYSNSCVQGLKVSDSLGKI